MNCLRLRKNELRHLIFEKLYWFMPRRTLIKLNESPHNNSLIVYYPSFIISYLQFKRIVFGIGYQRIEPLFPYRIISAFSCSGLLDSFTNTQCGFELCFKTSIKGCQLDVRVYYETIFSRFFFYSWSQYKCKLHWFFLIFYLCFIFSYYRHSSTAIDICMYIMIWLILILIII